MELLFYSLAGIIVIVVIAVSRKSIVAGMEARSDIKRENKPSNNAVSYTHLRAHETR